MFQRFKLIDLCIEIPAKIQIMPLKRTFPQNLKQTPLMFKKSLTVWPENKIKFVLFVSKQV